MRSIGATLPTLAPADLASLCPRARWCPDDQVPVINPGERALWRGHALVRLHGAVGADDGRPLRCSTDAEARLLSLAAGAGPVLVTDHRVVGVLAASEDRPALEYEVAWAEVDDVSPAPSGGVLLLATTLLGAVTLDPVRVLPD